MRKLQKMEQRKGLRHLNHMAGLRFAERKRIGFYPNCLMGRDVARLL